MTGYSLTGYSLFSYIWKGDLMEKQNIPWWMKLNLTIEEASEYSGIGESTLRDRINNGLDDFVLNVGKKKLIKRKLFEQYLEKITVI